MANMAKTVKEVLTATKWILENIGWCQYIYIRYDRENRPESFCLLGAIKMVVAPDEIKKEAIQAIEDAIAYQTDNWHNRCSVFNDDLGTYKEDVVKVLKKAITQQEERS